MKKSFKKVYKALNTLVQSKNDFREVAVEILQEDFNEDVFEEVYNFLWALRDELDYIEGER